jgi:hypothetical protein
MNESLICFFYSQIFELCHIFKGSNILPYAVHIYRPSLGYLAYLKSQRRPLYVFIEGPTAQTLEKTRTHWVCMYEGVSKSFRTGRLERELQTVQLSETRCSCIAILWASLVSFAAITLCIASWRVFIFVVYFVIDSVRKLLDTPSYHYGLTWVFLCVTS